MGDRLLDRADEADYDVDLDIDYDEEEETRMAPPRQSSSGSDVPTWTFSRSFDPQAEPVKSRIANVIFHPCYIWFYLMLLVACATMLAWTFSSKSITHLYVFVDLVVNLLILSDFGVRLYLSTVREFFSIALNVLDGLIVAACLITSVIEFVELGQKGHDEVQLLLIAPPTRTRVKQHAKAHVDMKLLYLLKDLRTSFADCRPLLPKSLRKIYGHAHVRFIKRRELAALQLDEVLMNTHEEDALYNPDINEVFAADSSDMPYVAFRDQTVY
ncbi:uncharacterized protein MONBRDRAFT_25172 [Monosiga brevicollis MX1]|uniref:Ion transport domain-containing protein n=1 Tax=Monosiga brevicollis TaxID=81824 RepID=A9UYL9_MONBE|nr:uncharacterized protein MONBRDRAFT_25172 [Monosiga brevicollis MX1]EDQ89486.1 predicted protein [Monosiga brevicollis MX1]|eukprot:XP_001745515.1 hypothetical protein [Monosiga brevicollis MX1]